jgi:hypothetical protein
MGVPANQHIEAPDLATEIGTIVGRGKTHAHFTASEWVLESHGALCVLAISVTNGDLHRRPPAEREALLSRIAEEGIAWLRRRGLAVEGTLVSVTLMREVDLRVVSWAWGVGGRAYWVDGTGALTSQRPSDGAPERE